MKHLYSPRMRVSTWRQLWVWLMEAQKELGLPITDEALAQMQANQIVKDEEFPIAAKEEERRRYVTYYYFLTSLPVYGPSPNFGLYAIGGGDSLSLSTTPENEV